MNGSWHCHVCGDERPDHFISVRKHETIGEHGVTFTQNVRYCNDRQACFEGAQTHRHLNSQLFSGEPLDGTRLAREIANTVPEANQKARMHEWRADLKRRVNARLTRRV